jgi:hypothetical protein
MENNTVGSYIVSWDFSRGNDTDILLVGSQKNGRVEVVNAFQGKDAHEVYEKLTKKIYVKEN